MEILNKKVIQINVETTREIIDSLKPTLAEMNIKKIFLESGRRMLLSERRGMFKVLSKEKTIIDDPINILSFLINPDMEEQVLQLIINKANLDMPGRGSIYSKKLNIYKSHDELLENNVNSIKIDSKNLLSELKGITCIVQKGEIEPIGRVGLDTGTGVPAITFGTGSGFRDRLGIWRIAVPAEKEICNLSLNHRDCEQIFNMMIDAGALDHTGKGFIYYFNINKGLLNTKFQIGTINQAASVEQIITVIDEMKGNSDWRRRELSSGGIVRKRKFLTNLIHFAVSCNEGKAADLTLAAMNAGAAGATIFKSKFIDLSNPEKQKITPAREVSNMIIGESIIEKITKELEENNLFSDEICGQILMSPVLKACTYLGK